MYQGGAFARLEVAPVSWRGLADTVDRLLRAGPPRFATDDLRLAAAELATRALPGAPPAAVNVAALALSMRGRLVVHRLAAGATRLVHETDLHSLPGEPPRLLRGPWIAEAREPERGLFAGCAALGGYPLDGAVFLVGLGYPDGAMVARWVPRWDGRDLAAGMPEPDGSPLVDDVEGHAAWAREAARFAVVLGLLLDAEGTPVATADEPRRRERRQAGRRPEWVVRRVYLDRLVRRAGGGAAEAASEPVDREHLGAAMVPVRGHLRRQPYGPGGALRRWVYVEGYEARRWVAPRAVVDVRVTEE